MFEYLLQAEKMLHIVNEIQSSNLQDEEQRRYLQEFFTHVLPCRSSLDKMRANNLANKKKLEDILEIN
ncbi:MAG: hypothetical protein FVQ83_11985 [Chloroflexi bacterium]|nr:hypothetical protein [Chloroflexota bacterium]